MQEQAAGLYVINVKNLETLEEIYVGETIGDGAFTASFPETTQKFFTKGGGGIATEAVALVGEGVVTVDLVFEPDVVGKLSTTSVTSGTALVFGTNHGKKKKEFEVILHPRYNNIANKDEDIKLYKAAVDVTTEIAATVDGKKVSKCVFTAMNKEITIDTPALPTITTGTGTSEVKYIKIVATNGTGVSLPNAVEAVTSKIDDDVSFVMPFGATGMTIYAATATGMVTGLKYYQATDAEITAGKVTDIGTKYATMTAATALPATATAYYYASGQIGV